MGTTYSLPNFNSLSFFCLDDVAVVLPPSEFNEGYLSHFTLNSIVSQS